MKTLISNICSIISPRLFEETGRYIVLRYLFSKDQQKNISISYGIGHGGIESILIWFTVLSNLLVKDTLIKNGLLKENITFFVFLMSATERLCAVICHISFSVWFLKQLRKKKCLLYFSYYSSWCYWFYSFSKSKRYYNINFCYWIK